MVLPQAGVGHLTWLVAVSHGGLWSGMDGLWEGGVFRVLGIFRTLPKQGYSIPFSCRSRFGRIMGRLKALLKGFQTTCGLSKPESKQRNCFFTLENDKHQLQNEDEVKQS